MKTNVCQRWREHRSSYRPAGEVIIPSEYQVNELQSDKVARNFVVTHHYSGTYPAARRRFGLYRFNELVGVAVFSVPCNNKTLTNTLGGEADESLELGRFVLLDNIPANAETWFLARCRKALKREGFRGIVSFSDPVARTSTDGSVMHGGHVGTIYQASNAAYVGRGTARTLRLLPDGTVLNDRTQSKIRKRERGFHYAVEILVKAGADPLRESQDAAAWLTRWKSLTRTLKHPGNFKYAWVLNGRDELRRGTYPKLTISPNTEPTALL